MPGAPARPSRSRQGRAVPGPGIRKACLPSPAAGLRLYTPDGAQKFVTTGKHEALPRDSKVVRSSTRRLAGLVGRRAGVAQLWGD